jgi:hypothetical protein
MGSFLKNLEQGFKTFFKRFLQNKYLHGHKGTDRVASENELCVFRKVFNEKVENLCFMFNLILEVEDFVMDWVRLMTNMLHTNDTYALLTKSI